MNVVLINIVHCIYLLGRFGYMCVLICISGLNQSHQVVDTVGLCF